MRKSIAVFLIAAFTALSADQLIAAMADQCIDQGAVGIARRRMHHQPGGLFDHDQVFVFIDHGERNILAARARLTEGLRMAGVPEG